MEYCGDSGQGLRLLLWLSCLAIVPLATSEFMEKVRTRIRRLEFRGVTHLVDDTAFDWNVGNYRKTHSHT